jgi:hypothetical protein
MPPLSDIWRANRYMSVQDKFLETLFAGEKVLANPK